VGSAWDASEFDSAEAILNAVPDSVRDAQNWSVSMVALLRARGRPQGAARLVRETAAGDPSPPRSPASRTAQYREALATAGWALSNGGNRDSVSRVLDHLLAAVPLDSLPPDARPYLAIAELYARAGNLARARGLIRDREATGQAQGARVAAEYVAEVSTDSGSSAANLSWGVIALAEGRLDTAVAHLRAAGREPPHMRGLPELAEAYEQKGMPDSGIAIYRRYLATKDLGRLLIDANARAGVVQRLAELSEKRGDKAGAIDAYEQFLALWKGAEPAQQASLRAAKARLAGLSGEQR
jgi:tetratricopeptide (TPR) repeat protein